MLLLVCIEVALYLTPSMWWPTEGAILTADPKDTKGKRRYISNQPQRSTLALCWLVSVNMLLG